MDCWTLYRDNDRSKLQHPHTTIVQSSGFGKSRLLYELAVKTQTAESMRVLYTCMRSNASSGFPKATPRLSEFFFPANCSERSIVQSLLVAFEYALKNWGGCWERVARSFSRLSKHKVEYDHERDEREDKRSTSSRDGSERAIVTPQSDADVCERLKAYVAQTPASIEHALSTSEIESDVAKRVLILAIDEARALLDDPV